MKRIIILPFLILFAVLNMAYAQNKMHKIQYAMSLENVSAGEVESIADLYVIKDFLRIENKFILSSVQLSDLQNEKTYLLDEENKTYTEQALVTDKISILDNGETLSSSDLTLQYVPGETKTIAGYVCQKAIATIPTEGEEESEVPTIEIWYTAKLPKLYWSDYAYLNSLPGAALSITVQGIGIEAFQVSELAINPDLFVIPADFQLIDEESTLFEPTSLGENRQTYQDEGTSNLGVADSTGEQISTAKYSYIQEYINGYAIVADAANNFGLINYEGKEVIPCQYEYFGRSQDSPLLYSKNGLYGYMSLKEEIIVPASYTSAREFVDGYAIVSTEEGTGVIDQKGKIIIPTKFPELSEFSNHTAVLAEQEKYYLIDLKGNKLSSAYDYIVHAGENLWLCMIDDKYGYLDTKGKQIIPAKYSYALDFVSGLALVSENSEDYFYIDTKGKFVKKM